ncbi:MAG: SMP-30/gluconolactonase/LRE family protein [Pseudaminobacter sp.]
MFAPPATIEPEVFAVLPDHFRRKPHNNRWLNENLRGADRGSLLEGPSFDRDGNLYLVDVPYGRVFRVDTAGRFTLISEYDGEPNGLKIHRDGRIFITDFRRGLVRLDPDTGSIYPVCPQAPDGPFHGLNDLVFAANGDLYFTDQGQSGLHDPCGRLFRFTADGQLQFVLQGIPSPNGVVLNLDESAIYVAVTRDNAVWRVPMTLDGNAAKVGAFIRLSGGIGPDGLALDEQGGLAVAHIGLGCVWIFDVFGQPRLRINAPRGRSVTNLAYGGGDLKDLYFIEAETGAILKARVDVAGQPLFAHADPNAGYGS